MAFCHTWGGRGITRVVKKCPSEGRWYAPTYVTPGVTCINAQIILGPQKHVLHLVWTLDSGVPLSCLQPYDNFESSLRRPKRGKRTVSRNKNQILEWNEVQKNVSP